MEKLTSTVFELFFEIPTVVDQIYLLAVVAAEADVLKIDTKTIITIIALVVFFIIIYHPPIELRIFINSSRESSPRN